MFRFILGAAFLVIIATYMGFNVRQIAGDSVEALGVADRDIISRLEQLIKEEKYDEAGKLLRTEVLDEAIDPQVRSKIYNMYIETLKAVGEAGRINKKKVEKFIIEFDTTKN